jgi:hypothetical protein
VSNAVRKGFVLRILRVSTGFAIHAL